MSVVTIGRTDVTDAVRSKVVRSTIVLMVLLVMSNWAADPNLISSSPQPALMALLQFGLWLPLFAIVLGYAAVTGERESGRIRVLLGQPVTRRDVVVGKYLSRAAVFSGSTSIAIALMLGLVAIEAGPPDPIAVVAGVAGVMLYGLAWLGASVGVSAIAASGKQVIGVMLTAYVIFVLLWESFTARLLVLAVTGSSDLATVIDFADPQVVTYADGSTWFLYAYRLNPLESFSGTVFYGYELLRAAFAGDPLAVAHGPNLFGVGVLLVWATVPVLAGYWWLKRTDL